MLLICVCVHLGMSVRVCGVSHCSNLLGTSLANLLVCNACGVSTAIVVTSVGCKLQLRRVLLYHGL